jgi:glycine/D-amino acid oxidase-like deaminating enzyme
MATTWGDIREIFKTYPILDRNIEVDAVIIGGGITGILNAYYLTLEGKKVALLERDRLASNATAMTTAFITKVIDTSLGEVIDIYGTKTAKEVWQGGQQAIEEIEKIVEKEKIDCEFKRCSNYFFASTAKQFKGLEEEYDAYKKLGLKAELHENGTDLNFPNFGYLEIKDQAKFHPLKFVNGVAAAAGKRGAQIFERTEALEISTDEGNVVKTGKGDIRAEDILIATYKPLTNQETHLKKAMYRSFIFEVEIPSDLLKEGIYEDDSNPYYYFRVDKGKERDRLIVGGEDHKDIFGDTLVEKSFKSLEEFLERILPGVKYKIVKKWYGPILEPSDGLPLIGEIKSNVYVATAFSGNGMTYSMISALLISDLIEGKKNKEKNNWQKIYDPKRALLRPRRLATKAKDFIEEFFEGAVKNLLKVK